MSLYKRLKDLLEFDFNLPYVVELTFLQLEFNYRSGAQGTAYSFCPKTDRNHSVGRCFVVIHEPFSKALIFLDSHSFWVASKQRGSRECCNFMNTIKVKADTSWLPTRKLWFSQSFITRRCKQHFKMFQSFSCSTLIKI